METDITELISSVISDVSDGYISKCMSLRIAVSSSYDSSFNPLADLFNQTPSRLIPEAFTHAAITERERRLFLKKYPPLSIARRSYKQLDELKQSGLSELARDSNRKLGDLSIDSPML